jgi:hypothetical protein
MRKHTAITLVLGVAAIGAFAASPAAATPPGSSCPADNGSQEDRGMQLLLVDDLTPLGYRVPAIVDDPANGGNGDGVICGVPLGNQMTPWGGQLYLFFDNQFGPAVG